MQERNKAVIRVSCLVKNLKGLVAPPSGARLLNVLFKYACAPGSRLVLTALSPTSPRRVVRKAG